MINIIVSIATASISVILIICFGYKIFKVRKIRTFGEKHIVEIIETQYDTYREDDVIVGFTTCRVIDNTNLNAVEFTVNEASYKWHKGDKITAYYNYDNWNLGTTSISGCIMAIFFCIIMFILSIKYFIK